MNIIKPLFHLAVLFLLAFPVQYAGAQLCGMEMQRLEIETPQHTCFNESPGSSFFNEMQKVFSNVEIVYLSKSHHNVLTVKKLENEFGSGNLVLVSLDLGGLPQVSWGNAAVGNSVSGQEFAEMLTERDVKCVVLWV